MGDGLVALVVVSFGLAALIVALSFLAIYTHRWKYRRVMLGSAALALAARLAVWAFNEHSFGVALMATTLTLAGLLDFWEYWRTKNNSATGTQI
jgi:hypothetical protein